MTAALAATSAVRLLMLHPRIHQPVAQLDEEVREEDADGHDDDHALHDGEVTAQDGIDEQDADRPVGRTPSR